MKSVFEDLNELSFAPDPFNPGPVLPQKDPFSLHYVVPELPTVPLPVTQTKLAPTVPLVPMQLPLVAYPLVPQLTQVCIVKAVREDNWGQGIDLAFAVKLVFPPAAFVGNGSVGIVKFSESMHLIILPLAFIVAALRKSAPAKALHPPLYQTALVLFLQPLTLDLALPFTLSKLIVLRNFLDGRELVLQEHLFGSG